MKQWFVIILCCLSFNGFAQELFVFTEPGSNIPAKSATFGVTARFPQSKYNSYLRNRYIVKSMAGVNKNWMVNVSASFSNFYRLDMLQYDGVKWYSKYRFLSKEGLHRHFRMAAYVAGAVTPHEYLYDEMSLDGDNDGVEGG